MIRTLFPLLSLVACGGATGLSEPADAEQAALDLVGGTTAAEAERVSEDGHDLWEVMVTMPNGAVLEVLLFEDDGALFEVADTEGPFDYDALDPLPGQLTYTEARDIAMGEVAGEQVAWEVKYDDGPYFYEFYVREAGDQLWEIKLWAESGDVFVVEGKDEID